MDNVVKDQLKERLAQHAAHTIERIAEATNPTTSKKPLTKAQQRARAARLAKGSALRAEEIQAIVERTAMRGAVLAEKGFDMAEECGDPKDFANAMRGTSTAVSMFRAALRLDKGDAQQHSVSLNVFVTRDDDVRPVRNVTPDFGELEAGDDGMIVDADEKQENIA